MASETLAVDSRLFTCVLGGDAVTLTLFAIAAMLYLLAVVLLYLTLPLLHAHVYGSPDQPPFGPSGPGAEGDAGLSDTSVPVPNPCPNA